MNEKDTPPLDLTPIRARLKNARVWLAGVSLSHSQPRGFTDTQWTRRQTIDAIKEAEKALAEVDRLRAEHGQLRQERDEQEAVALAAIEQSKQFDARLAAIRALPEQWRKEADYRGGVSCASCRQECAADLAGALAD